MVNCQLELCQIEKYMLVRRKEKKVKTSRTLLFPWLITFVGMIANKLKEKNESTKWTNTQSDVDVNKFTDRHEPLKQPTQQNSCN